MTNQPMKQIILCLAAVSLLTSCSFSDSSPEVTAQAMSYGGNVPIMSARGAIVGSQHVGESHRSTMLNP